METLELHFDAVFAAPDGIKKLRDLILTLAMQGKLVPQDPSDPPADELLKSIGAEKNRLLKEGKIKLQNALPPVTAVETPYTLPKGWVWTRLGEIGIWKSGSTPSRTNAAYFGGTIPWVKSGEVKQGRITETEESITELALSECPLALNPKGSVLVAMYGANIGEVGLLEIEATTNQAICACQTYTQFDEQYLLNLITSLKQYFVSKGAGAAQPNISREKIIATPFPLPPIPEQHRIVAKIDELMARCEALEKLRTGRDAQRLAVHAAALRQLLKVTDTHGHIEAREFLTRHFGELYTVKENITELRKAILQLGVMGKLVPQDPNDSPASELLKRIEAEKKRLVREGKIKEPKPLPQITSDESPFLLPNGWVMTRLDDLLIYGPTNGTSPKAVEYETGVRSLTLSATTSGKFKGEYLKFVDIEIPPDSDLWLQDGDILVQRGNTLEYVGVPAIFRGNTQTYIYPDLMMKIRLSQCVCVEYVYYAMSSEISRDYLRSRASGTSGTMPKINQGTLRRLPIPLPPLSEQNKVVTQIEHLLSLCDSLEQQIDSVNETQSAMLSGMMAQFEGQQCA